MNRRKLAMQIIIAEIAQNGHAGKCAIRAYVETRLSRENFDKACKIGQKIYKRKQAKV